MRNYKKVYPYKDFVKVDPCHDWIPQEDELRKSLEEFKAYSFSQELKKLLEEMPSSQTYSHKQ